MNSFCHSGLDPESPEELNMKRYYVYILTNTHNTVLYTGVTNSLERRIVEHKEMLTNSFSKKYNLHKLVYFEESYSISDAIGREKQLKNWKREWKLDLIKKVNPTFRDLFL